ncbi:AEC family transporter [Frigidibacter mobilis]|uniref:Putative malonate transporter n=1 Tax=Frigidibacter mobilis TaxID=1335048 RepID=A0A165STJ6_9RHOB|nr:AEC family transporter [Frigidibacter mobilis]AMY70933.1 putative malonate transporter [Frigidibacter mobilis]
MDAVNAILPLFAVILIGFLAVRTGYVPAEALRPVGEVVLRIALPALIFLSVAGAAPGEGLQPVALLAIGIGSLAAFACGALGAVWILGMPLRQAAMVALGISASNSGFIGYPVVQQLLGTAEAGRLLAHMMVIENLMMIPLALILSSNAGGGGSVRGSALLRDLARNPLILALGAALAFQVVGLSLPDQASRTLDLLARMSAPAALLVVGATLATLRPRGQAGAVALIVLGKLLLHPALTLAAFAAVGGLPAQFVLGAVLFAAMPMMSVYPILSQRAGLGPLAASALLVATVLGTVSIPLWLPGLRQLGLG